MLLTGNILRTLGVLGEFLVSNVLIRAKLYIVLFSVWSLEVMRCLFATYTGTICDLATEVQPSSSFQIALDSLQSEEQT